MFKFKSNIVERELDNGFSVEIICVEPQVDRTYVYGYGLNDSVSHRKLAERLCKAVDAGVVTPNPVIKTDVNGNTYVSHDITVFGRHMNSDLKALGY